MGGSRKQQMVASIANRPQGGGNKKQGLPPSIGRAGWLSNFIRIQAGGYFRSIPADTQKTITNWLGKGGFSLIGGEEKIGGLVTSIVLSNDGNSLYVGGAFNSYTNNGVTTTVNNLAKINLSDFSLDTKFISNGEGFGSSGFFGSVQTIILSNDGNSLYVGGRFSFYTNNGVTTAVNNLAKLTADKGALDTDFVGANEGFNIGARVAALVLSGDGTSLYVGGDFTSYIKNGVTTTVGCIAKLNANDGELITGFVSDEKGFSHPTADYANVSTMVLSGNNLYVGGRFNSYMNTNGGNKTPQCIAKLAADTGALDTSFVNDGEGLTDITETVATMVLSNDENSLYIGGQFDSYTNTNGGGTPQCIAKLAADTGALDTNFVDDNEGFNLSGIGNVQVGTMVLSGNNLYVGGDFTSYTNTNGSRTPKFIAKLAADTGALDTNFVDNGEGFNPTQPIKEPNVSTIVLSGNNLYVGLPYIDSYKNSDGTTAVNGIASLNATTGTVNKIQVPK